ncbi:MAG: WD40/YVTN/BNR-like repeat-containing protein, partial [bacterium]
VNAFTASGTTILAGSHGGGVFLSIDGGLTWTAPTTQPANPFAFVRALASSGTTFFAGTEIVFAGTDAGGVSRSTDGGQTWTAVGSDPMTMYSVHCLATRGEALFAGTGKDGIWRYPLQ